MDESIRARRYRRRAVDDELDELIAGGVAAIALEGARGVGKRATAAERASVAFLLEDPSTRQVLEADPARILVDGSVLIDEWQHLPSTWDTVRRAVDAGAPAGQFLLTGSASTRPDVHSGAGRILTVRMRPMAIAERGVESPSVSLAMMLSGEHPAVEGETSVRLDAYVDEIVRSGFPGIRTLEGRVRRSQLSGYIDRVIDRDVADVRGRQVRNPAALRRWLTAYAAATSTTTSFEKIRDAATAGEGDKPAKTTVGAFRDALESLYVLDPVPAWSPTNNHIVGLGEAPKHHLADPGLAAALLGLGTGALIDGTAGGLATPRDGTFLGALFESLVTLEVRVAAQAAEARVGHLRAHRGAHEVDLIVERSDRRVVAVEIKLSATVTDDDVKHLRWLRTSIGDDLLDAMVVTTGPYAYRRSDGIAVVPAALLGP